MTTLQRNKPALIRCGVASFICAIGIIALSGISDGPLYLVLGGLTFITVSPFLFSRIDLLKPIYWLSVGFFLHICVRAWLIALEWGLLRLSSPYLSYRMALDLVLPGALIAGIGFICFMLGYFLPFPKDLGALLRKKTSLILLPNRRTIILLFIIWSVGWIFRIGSILQGGSSFWLNVIRSAYIQPDVVVIGPLELLASIRRIGFVGLWGFYFQRTNRSVRLSVLCYVMLYIEMLFGIASGLKQFIIEPILAVAIAYAIGRPGARIRFRLIAFAGVIFLLALIWVREYRTQALNLGWNATRGEVLREVLLNGWRDLHLNLQGILEELANRLVFDNLLLVLAYVPEPIPFAYGGTFLPQMLTSLIPQLLWRGRSSLGRNFFAELSGPYVGGTAPTLIGDLYFNFGIVGVFVGMLAVGLIMRTLYEWLASCRRVGIGGVIVFGVLLLRWFDVVGLGMINVLYPLVRELPIALVVVWLIRDKRSRTSINPGLVSEELR